MAATLNQDDIKLLKSIFVTKDDLTALETRMDQKFATKDDLIKMEKRIIKRMDLVDGAIDQVLMSTVREVNRIKLHIGLPLSNQVL